MNKKDITLVTISVVFILASSYVMFNMLGVGKKSTTKDVPIQNNQTQTEITGKFDEDTLEKLKNLKDYGGAELNNIGRVNPFGPLN